MYRMVQLDRPVVKAVLRGEWRVFALGELFHHEGIAGQPEIDPRAVQIQVAARTVGVIHLCQQVVAAVLDVTIHAARVEDLVAVMDGTIMATLAVGILNCSERAGMAILAFLLDDAVGPSHRPTGEDGLGGPDSHNKRGHRNERQKRHQKRQAPASRAEPMVPPQVVQVQALGQSLGVQHPSLIWDRLFFLGHFNTSA